MSCSDEKKTSKSRPIIDLLSLGYNANYPIISVSLLLFLSPAIAPVGAQYTNNGAGSDPQYPKFSPSMAIIIVIFITALFFMGFFSIYIRHCGENASGSIRPALSMRSRRAATSRGLDAAIIETFPTFVYSEVKGLKIGKGALECAVCLNEFEDNETLRLIPKCDHVFHPECVDVWLTSHVTCPVCRANLAGDSVHLPGDPHPDSHIEDQITEVETQQNGDVSIRVDEVHEVSSSHDPPPKVMNRNWSMNQNRPPRSGSVQTRVGKFPRSHSTGHSLVQPGENLDRFTLRLPEEVRKQVLNRTASNMAVLAREGNSKRVGGSSRGRSYSRLDRLDGVVKSDRWIFSRAFSMRSPKMVAAADGEGSTSSTTSKGLMTAVRMPSFKCLEPKGDETGLVSAGSARSPV